MTTKLGDEGVFTKTITEADIGFFAAHSGDFHPLHMNEQYAKTTRFKGRIVHGLLPASLISTALSKIPGVSGYLSQSLNFKKPVRVGDTITACCRAIEIEESKLKIARFTTICKNQYDEIVVDGEAKVIVAVSEGGV